MLEGPETTDATTNEKSNQTPTAARLDTPVADDAVLALHALIDRLQGEIKSHKTKIEALNFEIARLKRWRFGSSSESLDSSTQAVLFDQIVADTALEDQAAKEELRPPATTPAAKRRPVRQALPAGLPRIEHRHEIEQTHCACGQVFKRVGEEVSEQLDCVPAQFFVHRHIRGKYACAACCTIQAAPMPAQVIDKGIPAPGLLAQVVVAKHDDHLPLYRQEEIYARSGVHIPRSSMAQWIGICGVRLAPLAEALKDYILGQRVIHADETPVSLLAPGHGKTKRAYVWVYRTTNFVAERAVLFDFSPGRGGEHPRRVLRCFAGTLVSDDFSGYHALHAQGITAALCMAHARRKLFEVHALTGSPIAGQAVALIAKLYEIEREARGMKPEERLLLPPARQTDRRRAASLAQRETPAPGQGRRDGQGDRLCAVQLARADALPGRRRCADRQQRGRECGAPARCRSQLCELRSYANSTRGRAGVPSVKDLNCVAAASHDQRDCRNCINPLGGRYRAGLTAGGFSRARVRSFMARSASTYM